MRTLKEQIALDRKVFLNPKEFGEELLVDGIPCLGCWDEEDEKPVRQYFGAGMEEAMGVFTVERILFYMREDGALPETPVPEQELDIVALDARNGSETRQTGASPSGRIDGKRWTVRDSRQEAGIVEVNLYRNEV